MKKVAVNTELGMFRGHSQSDNEKDVIDSLPQSSYQAQYSLHPAHPSSITFSMPVQKMSVPVDINKEELMDTEGEQKKDGSVVVDNTTREERHDETPNSPSELKSHNTSKKSAVRKDIEPALAWEEKENEESALNSERVSQNLPQRSTSQKILATKSKIKVLSIGQVEDDHEKYHQLQLTQTAVERKESFTKQETKKGVEKKQKSDPGGRTDLRNPGASPKRWDFFKVAVSPMTTSQSLEPAVPGPEPWLRPGKAKTDVTQKLECKGSSEKSQKSFHKDHQEQESSVPGHRLLKWFSRGKKKEKQSKAVMLPKPIIESKYRRFPKLDKDEVEMRKAFQRAVQARNRKRSQSRSNLTQVEEIKNKPQPREAPEEGNEEKLNEDKMTGKVHEMSLNVKDHQCTKSEENKIPRKEIPKMTISSSTESSVPVHHHLKWFPLERKEEKQSKVGMLFQTIRRKLRRNHTSCSKGEEMKQSFELTVQSLAQESISARSDLKQNEEEQHATQSQNDRVLQDGLLSKLITKQNEIEATTFNVNQISELDIERGKVKKLIEIKQSLESCLHELMKRKEELQKDISRLRKNKLEEYDKGDVDSEETLKHAHSEVDAHINMLKNKTPATFLKNTEDLRGNHDASLRNEIECRIRNMESELSKLKNSHQDAEEQLKRHRQFYFKELETNESLSKELDRAKERLTKVDAELQNKTQRSETLNTSFTASPVLELPPIEHPNSSLVFIQGLIPKGNSICCLNHHVFKQ